LKPKQMTLSDAKLLTQLHAGDIASFETLFLRHYERVYGVLLRLVGDQAEAEDIAQQVFLKLYAEPERIKTEADDTNLIGWLYRVAVNEGYNVLRSQKRRTTRQERFSRLWPFGSTPADPAQLAEQRTMQAQVRQVLAEMKPREAKLLLLRHSGLSYKELAAVLDVAPGSIGSLLTRAERVFAKKYRLAFPDKE
jgi:RNA polymerase sigma-70 factor (ECF subfamily)